MKIEIPTPRANESKDDYIDRCFGGISYDINSEDYKTFERKWKTHNLQVDIEKLEKSKEAHKKNKLIRK
jgi:hypothetical protein